MEKSIISKILIVGAGLTGSVTASLIKHEASANIEIWEKGNRIGGRFYTFHNGSTDPPSSVDFGAQYVSATLEFIRSQARFYDDLLDKDKLVPLGQKIENFRKLSESRMNFVAPEGADSLVHHFLNKAEVKPYLEHEVVEINLKEAEKVWEVKASNGTVKEFDSIILTIPVPEVLKLKGNFHNINQDDDVKMAMEQVKFSSRHAVALLYKEPVKALEELPWSMKYFPDDDTICFVSVDNRKRGRDNEVPAVLLHTTTKFSQKVLDSDEDEVQKHLLDHLKAFLPELPEPSSVMCVKWSYSQVIDAYIDNPGCIILSGHPCLICGGDSFTESNFNGCITSALRIVEELLKYVIISKCNKNSTKKSAETDMCKTTKKSSEEQYNIAV